MPFNVNGEILTDLQVKLYNDTRIVRNGLVFYVDAGIANSYPGSGTTFTDLSGNSNNGTLLNGPTYTTFQGGGIVFDGTNDYVSVPDSSTLEPTTALTMEAVFRMTTKNTFNTVMVKPFNGPPWSNPFLSYMLRVQNASLQIGMALDGTYRAVDHVFNYVTGTTYYVSFTYANNGTFAYYVNGQAVSLTGTMPSASSITYSTPPLIIGAGYGSSPIGETFTGNIYLSRLYNRALSASEVLQNFNANRARFGL